MQKIHLLILSLVCLAGCSTASPIRVDMSVSPNADPKAAGIIEQKLGNAGYYYMILNYKLVDEPQILNQFKRISARINAFTERPEITYNFFIIDSKYRGAFSLPDGYIILTSSFLKAVPEEDMLAAVIAHEIAHVAYKHALLEYQQKVSASFASILGEKIFKNATQIHYRQAYELQADQTALRYLQRAGYPLESMIKMLERLEQMEKEDQAEFKKDMQKDPALKRGLEKDLVPDHPDTINRIINVRNYIAEVLKTESIKYDPKNFNF